MKLIPFKIGLLIAIMISTSHTAICGEYFPTLPLKYRQKRILKIKTEVEERFNKVKELVGDFSKYQKDKPKEEIKEEFKKIDSLRHELWYDGHNANTFTSSENYTIAQSLFKVGNDQWPLHWLAFEYNHADDSYNASTILIKGHDLFHFIALKEPVCDSVDHFFKVLINHDAKILVRLNPQGDSEYDGIKYWEDKLVKGENHDLIKTRIDYTRNTVQGPTIPYFYTNSWPCSSAIELEELYDLVTKVHETYGKSDLINPIVVHCSNGASNTGTFIAAFIIADKLSYLHSPKSLSLESIVLELSIQRPQMVINETQYLLLYEFIDYYKNRRGHTDTEL